MQAAWQVCGLTGLQVACTASGHGVIESAPVGTCLYLGFSAPDHVSGICIPVDRGYLAFDAVGRRAC